MSDSVDVSDVCICARYPVLGISGFKRRLLEQEVEVDYILSKDLIDNYINFDNFNYYFYYFDKDRKEQVLNIMLMN